MLNRWVMWSWGALLLAACAAGSLSAAGAAPSVESWLVIDTDRDVLVLDGNDWMTGTVSVGVGGSRASGATVELANWGTGILQLAPIVDGQPAWSLSSADPTRLAVTAASDGKARFALRSRAPLQRHLEVPRPEVMARWNGVRTWRRIPCLGVADGIDVNVQITPDVLDPGYHQGARARVVVSVRYNDGHPFAGTIMLQSHPGYLEPREGTGGRCELTFDGSGAPREVSLIVSPGTEVREGAVDFFLAGDTCQWFAKTTYRVRCCVRMDLDARVAQHRAGGTPEYVLTARALDADGKPLAGFPVFPNFGKMDREHLVAVKTDAEGRAEIRVAPRNRQWQSIQWLSSSCVTQQMFMPPLIRADRWVDLPRVLKAAGAEVVWDKSRHILRATKGERTVEVTPGRLRVGYGNSYLFIDKPPRLKRGRLFVTQWALDHIRIHLFD